ncbi:MAG: chemotaxis protein CheC [Ruminococcus sp.]|jgi:chemotaxis protein CheC|nr:chemotaxis protein CheC [Ruminococcus sp.]
MAIKNFENLNDVHIDVLRELGNIGSGNAATSLSGLTGQKVRIDVPNVKILSFNDAMEFVGGPEKISVGLVVPLLGQVTGMILYLFGDNFINAVVEGFFGHTIDDIRNLAEDEMSRSAVQEIGNIMSGSYVNALSLMSGLTIDIAPPEMRIDMAGAILSVPAVEFATVGDSVLFINDTFIMNDKKVDSNMILVPDIPSLNLIFEKLGVSV